MAVPSIHKKDAPKELKFALVTCSSTRYTEKQTNNRIEDLSGDLAEKLLSKSGHKITIRTILPDDLSLIRGFIIRTIQRKDVDSIILIGGTGLSYNDVTIEAVQPLLEREITGFGEIFRMVSFNEIGSPAIMSRALAGIINKRIIFCLPGAPDAVKLALKRLILPEIGHISKLIRE